MGALFATWPFDSTDKPKPIIKEPKPMYAHSNEEKRKKYEKEILRRRYKKRVVEKCAKEIKKALGKKTTNDVKNIKKIQIYLTKYQVMIDYKIGKVTRRFSINNSKCMVSIFAKNVDVEIYP